MKNARVHGEPEFLGPEPEAHALSTARRWLEQRRAELRRVVGADDTGPLAKELDRVDAALTWLRAGVYGHCRVCGSHLAPEVIERDPAEMLCSPCSETSSRYRKQRGHAHPMQRSSRCPPMRSLADGPEENDLTFQRASEQASANVNVS
jgi:RNA polymerase-binding transcription factor DksA